MCIRDRPAATQPIMGILATLGATLAPTLEPTSHPVFSAPPIALIQASDFPSAIVVDELVGLV